MNKRDSGRLLLIIVLTCVVRSGYLYEPANIDQGLESAIGREIWHGKKLYSEVWDHRCPVIYYLYAMGFWVFGEQNWSFHVLELVNTVLAVVLLYYWLKLEFGTIVAFSAGLCYACIFNHVLLGGWFSRAESEIFYEIPIILIFWLTHYRTQLWVFFAQGALWALLLFIKLPTIVFILCIGAHYLQFYRKRNFSLWRAIFYFSLGALAFTTLFLLWFSWRGNLSAFVQYVFIYNLSYRSAGIFDNIQQLWAICYDSFYLAPLAAIALYGYIRYALLPSRKWLLLLWPWVAILQVVIQGKYWWYQFIPCITPLCVWFAWGLYMLGKKLLAKERYVFWASVLGVWIILTPFFTVCISYYQAHPIHAYVLGKISYRELVATYNWYTPHLDVQATMQAGEYLKNRAQKDDTMLIFGVCGQLYLYSHLSPASKYIFISNDMYDNYYGKNIIAEICHDLHRYPRFVVVIRDRASLYGLLARKPIPTAALHIARFIHSRYRVIKIFADIYIYEKITN